MADASDQQLLLGDDHGRAGKGDKRRKERFPFAIYFIIGNEFCERFSYYGMRAILVLYFKVMLTESQRRPPARCLLHARTLAYPPPARTFAYPPPARFLHHARFPPSCPPFFFQACPPIRMLPAVGPRIPLATSRPAASDPPSFQPNVSVPIGR